MKQRVCTRNRVRGTCDRVRISPHKQRLGDLCTQRSVHGWPSGGFYDVHSNGATAAVFPAQGIRKTPDSILQTMDDLMLEWELAPIVHAFRPYACCAHWKGCDIVHWPVLNYMDIKTGAMNCALWGGGTWHGGWAKHPP